MKDFLFYAMKDFFILCDEKLFYFMRWKTFLFYAMKNFFILCDERLFYFTLKKIFSSFYNRVEKLSLYVLINQSIKVEQSCCDVDKWTIFISFNFYHCIIVSVVAMIEYFKTNCFKFIYDFNISRFLRYVFFKNLRIKKTN